MVHIWTMGLSFFLRERFHWRPARLSNRLAAKDNVMRSAKTFVVCIIFLSALAMAQIPYIEQPLAPTAVQPGSTKPITLTITGAGFTSDLQYVLWQQGSNSAQLPIASFTATQITTTVPVSSFALPGTAWVSVVADISDTNISSNVEYFQIATPVTSPQFAPLAFYSVGGTAQSMLVADFNGDGILDLATLVSLPGGGSDVCILLGISGGTFPSTATCYQVPGATSMVAGVFTPDGGGLDIVAGDFYLENNVVSNQETGTFTVNDLNANTPDFQPYVVGDFNQSGVLSIAGNINGNVQILQSEGGGVFTVGQNFATSTTEFGGMLAADFDGDGILDLAVLDVYEMDPLVRVFHGAAGTAGFSTTPKTTSTPAGGVAFTAGDFNASGNQGLAFVYNPSDTTSEVLILNGNGDGTFTSGFSESLAIPVTPAIVTTADFNADGNLDLATGTYILLGNGDGTFQTATAFCGECSGILATGDFNGDGRPDAVTGGNPDVNVYLQQAPAAPIVSLKPTSLTFSSQTVGTTSASQSVTLSNTGNAVLALDSLTVTGTNASEFSVTYGSCSASLGANSACVFTVAFTPTAAGPAAASVSVADNAAGSPQTVSLTGTGAGQSGAPVVSLSPTSLTFTALAVGTTSASQTVTLSNTGTAALNIGSITVSGTTYADFSQTNNCGTSLAVGAAPCTISVTATPTAVGPVTASISITDNAADSPQTVPLAGTGSPFALTTSCTALTVVPGQTAEYTVDLAPASGFTPTVALACSGAPSLGTCTVSTITMPLTGPATATVTATTTRATGFLQSPFDHSKGDRMAGLVGLAGIGGFAALVVLPGKRRGKPGRRLYGLIFLLCLLATVATLPSCGGGADPPGTPVGTYPLTVTGTFQYGDGGTITETVNFNLVVQQ
jgi:hypothetical protein